MARGINKVILVGNCGQDPETRYTTGGAAITNISIATSESWTDKNTNQKQERTEWHRVVFFNRLAEIAGEYLKKGAKVYIEGQLRTRKWADQQGVEHYTTEIVASEMQMLDSRDDNAKSAAPQQHASHAQQQRPAPNQRPAPPQNQPMGVSQGGHQAPPEMDYFADEIPF